MDDLPEKTSIPTQGWNPMTQRRDRLLTEPTHDPTKPSKKLADPTVCPDCGATFRDGRWTWRHGPVEAPRTLCSACQRIRDDYAAGFVTLRGSFVREHRDEILALSRHTEEREKAEHPIKRIMDISDDSGDLVIRTTDVHLARDIGSAVHRAYKGTLNVQYDEDIARVEWVRES
jgi:NMD protein affecting ribosome stability and mRNA decay